MIYTDIKEKTQVHLYGEGLVKSGIIDLKHNSACRVCAVQQHSNKNNLNECTWKLKDSYARILIFLGISGNDVNHSHI